MESDCVETGHVAEFETRVASIPGTLSRNKHSIVLQLHDVSRTQLRDLADNSTNVNNAFPHC